MDGEDPRGRPCSSCSSTARRTTTSFFDALRLAPGAVVVADNIPSHGLWDYVAHVRARPGIQSVTLAVGKGLEMSRLEVPARAIA